MYQGHAAEQANQLWQRSVAHARNAMGAAMRQRFDPEDVVQSMLKSFIRKGEMPALQEELECLLFFLTDWKLSRSIRKAKAGKRDVARDQPIGTDAEEAGFRRAPVAEHRQQSPEEEAIEKEVMELSEKWWSQRKRSRVDEDKCTG
jgi:hypothetical protein